MNWFDKRIKVRNTRTLLNKSKLLLIFIACSFILCSCKSAPARSDIEKRFYASFSLSDAEKEKERTEISQLDPEGIYGLYSLGWLAGKGNNAESELNYYSKAIAIDPNFTKAYYARGLNHSDAKRWAECISDLERVKAAEPTNLDIPYYLGFAYYMQQNPQKMTESFDPILKNKAKFEEGEYFIALLLSTAAEFNSMQAQLSSLKTAKDRKQQVARNTVFRIEICNQLFELVQSKDKIPQALRDDEYKSLTKSYQQAIICPNVAKILK